MSWPGSTLPAGARPAKRRKGRTNRRATGATQRWIAKESRKAKLIPAAPTSKVIARCPEHVPYEKLGFLSLGDFTLYCDAMARRGGKLARVVRIPREKLVGMPEAARVVAVLCKTCHGRLGNFTCPTCGTAYPWGIRITLKRGVQVQ